MKRLKRILAILAVNCLLLGAGIIILELVFGGWFSTNNMGRLNLLRDCVLKYDVSHLYDNPQPIIKYSRDKYGLRGTFDRPGSIDILTVGGSTTDQRYIRDGETWQDVLQERFAQAGVTVDIANAGVDGQSSYGHIKNFEWWFPFIPGLKPDYILFYIGLNDFHKEAGFDYDHIMTEKQDLTLKQKIKENSALWHVFRTLRGAYEAMVVKQIGHRAVDLGKVRWTSDTIQNDYSFMEPRLKEYSDRLRVLIDLTHKLGAKPVFVSQPSRKYRLTPDGLAGNSTVYSYNGHEYNGTDYFYMMRKVDSVTKAVANENDALFVDLASYTGWVDEDFYDFAHMTPQGAEKVGVLMWRALRDVITGAEQGAAQDGDTVSTPAEAPHL